METTTNHGAPITLETTQSPAVAAATAGSPSLVPFHEAAVVEHKNAEYHDGCVLNLPGDRTVEVWRVKDSTGYLVRILAPTTDGKRSLLKFGLTRDAAKALHDTLCAQIRGEND